MTYPDVIDLSVTIAGNAVENYIDDGNITYKDALGAMADNWKFTLVDPAVVPAEWDEVIVYDGVTKIMAGYIVSTEKLRWYRNNSKAIAYSVECAGYDAYLERIRVKEEYENQSDADIIADLVASYSTDYNGVTYVNELKEYANRRYNRKTMYGVIDELATDANAQWYVDNDKNIHYFLNEENAAPFNISDSPDLVTTFPAADYRIYTDGTGLVNRVEVIGGNYLSNNQTDYFAGTGQSNKINLAFRYVKPTTDTAVQMWRNDGTEGSPVWTPLTVKIGYIDTLSSTNEALYYFQEKTVEQTDVFPNLNNALKITGRYEVPLRLRKRDQVSYTHYGKWFDGVIANENIINKDDANIAAAAMLAKSAMATVSIECKVRKHGLRAGHTIHVYNANLGINSDYLIHQVNAEITIGGYAVYDLMLGTYNPGLVDYMLALVRTTGTSVTWRDDEVLDEILDYSETLALAESYSAVITSQAPYKWGSFKWGFAKWSV